MSGHEMGDDEAARMGATRHARTMLPYGDMVRNLFKLMGSTEADLMHAAVGMCGEAAELLEADTRANVIEELGDFEFYLEALRQHSGLSRHGVLHPGDALPVSLALVGPMLCVHAGRVLDLVKKSWVYGKVLDRAKLAYELAHIEVSLAGYRNLMDAPRELVLAQNQTKLAIRYPDGVYTDLHAQQRLDKAEGQSPAQ